MDPVGIEPGTLCTEAVNAQQEPRCDYDSVLSHQPDKTSAHLPTQLTLFKKMVTTLS